MSGISALPVWLWPDIPERTSSAPLHSVPRHETGSCLSVICLQRESRWNTVHPQVILIFIFTQDCVFRFINCNISSPSNLSAVLHMDSWKWSRMATAAICSPTSSYPESSIDHGSRALSTKCFHQRVFCLAFVEGDSAPSTEKCVTVQTTTTIIAGHLPTLNGP